VCKQLDHIIAGYLRHVWDKNDWLHKGQHGFRPGHSCETSVCQDIVDSLDKGVGIDATIQDFQGSQSNLRCDARGRFGPNTISSICKSYLEEQ
jgi:hypothetical protein